MDKDLPVPEDPAVDHSGDMNRRSDLKLAAAFAAAVLLAIPLKARAFSGPGEEPVKISHDKLTGLLSFSPKTVFFGGYMIPSADSINGPLVVIDGSLDLQNGAVLDGDAWIVNGKLIMTGSSRITGKVSLVNSGVFLSSDAAIGGQIERYSCECRLDDKLFESQGRVVFEKFEDPRAVRTKFTIESGQTSRVDYSPVTIGIKRENELHRDPYVRGHAWVGYSMIEKTTGRLGFDASFSVPVIDDRLSLILSGYKRTFTNDDWMLTDLEAGLIVMMTGDDYFDYWEKQGGSAGIEFSAARSLKTSLSLSFQKELSLEARSISSLFNSRSRFRPNPPIDEGDRLALSADIVFDNRGEDAWRENAWRLSLWAEKGIADGPGDFSYLAFDIDVRRYNYLPFGMRLDATAKIFSSFDPLPLQLTRSLNGYGGVRGLSDIPFDVARGDRMALARVELRKSIPELPVFRLIFTKWSLLAFADAGYLVMAANPRSPFGFLDGSLGNWKKSAGLGISGESIVPYVGLYFAQDIDADSFSPRVIFRIERSF